MDAPCPCPVRVTASGPGPEPRQVFCVDGKVPLYRPPIPPLNPPGACAESIPGGRGFRGGEVTPDCFGSLEAQTQTSIQPSGNRTLGCPRNRVYHLVLCPHLGRAVGWGQGSYSLAVWSPFISLKLPPPQTLKLQ